MIGWHLLITGWERRLVHCVSLVLLREFSLPSSLGGWLNGMVFLLDPVYFHRFNKAFYTFYPCLVFPKTYLWPGCRELEFFLFPRSVCPGRAVWIDVECLTWPWMWTSSFPIFREIWPLNKCPQPTCVLWTSSSAIQRWSVNRVFHGQISSETGMFSLPLLEGT